MTVWLALPCESDGPQVWEGLAVSRLQRVDRVRVCAIPLIAYDVNYGDELAVVASAEGPLVATGVVTNGGNYTFRVWLSGHTGWDAIREVVTEFGGRGCLVEGYSDRLIGLTCGAAEAPAVADALAAGERQGRFLYETGRQRTS